jgi:F0F1-type ATP synthase assembly protein I
MEKKEPKKSPDSSKSKHTNSFLKYTDVAFRMIVIILIGVFGGTKLDAYFNLTTPIFTLVLSLLSVGFAMYSVIKGITKKND